MISPGSNLLLSQYIFGDFVLRSDGILLYQEQEFHVPPKELEVFIMLLQSAGKIVTKNEIFDTVWRNNPASDESLTRCIYVLRRLLHEEKCSRHIETIYGKGYRFKSQVAVVSNSEPKKCNITLAIFPFKTPPSMDANLLHHSLIQGLSRYAGFGLNVLPASATQDCCEFNAISALITQLKPDYYLTGRSVSQGSNLSLFFELVRASDHRLIDHRSIMGNKTLHAPFILASVLNLLVEKIPQFRLNEGELPDTFTIDSALTCLNGKRELHLFTPNSINKALELFQSKKGSSFALAEYQCCLAESYIALTQLGLYEQESALANAMCAVDKAIETDPGSAHALSILGLLSALRGETSVAEVLFKQAHFYMPGSSDVLYNKALFFLLKGKLKEALALTDQCLDISPDKTAAFILKLWLTCCTISVTQAFLTGHQYLQYNNSDNPIILSIVAMFAAMTGKQNISEKYLAMIQQKDECGCIEVNNLYTRYLIYGREIRSKLVRFLDKADFSKMKSNLLPLILVTYGRFTMQKQVEELKRENDAWSSVWLKDPRLSGATFLPIQRKLHGQAA